MSVGYMLNFAPLISDVMLLIGDLKMNYPWNESPLNKWDIVGMNHYHLDGKKCLFVAMTRGDVCIQAENENTDMVFTTLKKLARNHGITNFGEA